MIIATCNRGMEDICVREMQEITGKRAIKEANGLICLHTPWNYAFRLNYLAKTINRVILLLKKSSFFSLHDLYEIAGDIDYGFIDDKQSFAVRFSRHGKHEFTSIDAERMVGQAVIDSYKAEYGKRLKVNLEEPDVMIRGFIKNDLVWIGIDTTGESLHKRGYRIYRHPAPLQTTIANALIRISGWKGEPLYDPCCGSGTIPIEAYLYGNAVPNKWRWKTFLLWNLKIFDKEDILEEKGKIDGRVGEKEYPLYGSDISPKHIEGAKMNAREANARVNFFVMDVARARFDYDIIITNPPYGMRVSSARAARKINAILERKIMDGNCRKAIIFTAETENLENFSYRHAILYGKLWTYAMVYEKM